jgi:hypothetical protein
MKWLIVVTLIITACALFVAADVRAQSAEAAENPAKLQRVLRAADVVAGDQQTALDKPVSNTPERAAVLSSKAGSSGLKALGMTKDF